MCSIAGVYWFNRSTNPKEDELYKMAEKALAVLANRGPDESSLVAVNKSCILAGNRLIIRGSINQGSMPFNHDGNTLFYNGEIYNYKQWNSKAISDGEVILPLYKDKKQNAFVELDGEFAISLWDNKEECLYLVRDFFGTKPIYFSLNEDRLLWASSASAINAMEKHAFCSTVKGPTYKHAFDVQEPYTSFKGIWLIPPGHFLKVNKNGAKLFCYNLWSEYKGETVDTKECFKALSESLETRMDFDGVMGIPMSGGIDSGIIAFMADKLKVKYQIFSLVEVFGQKTEETEAILSRVGRLKNCEKVNLIKFGEKEYQKALSEIFLPDYYDSERFGNGDLLMHAVFDAMHKEKIKVAIDGSGGDELFHGYKFHEDYRPVPGWPENWKNTNYFYSLYTTLLDYTSKSDRAGAHFSIEARYPYQNAKLMQASLKLKFSDVLKWPLRKFLLENLDYGAPTDIDKHGKYGFSIKNKKISEIISDMQSAWCKHNGLVALSEEPPLKFPFQMGIKLTEEI